MLFLPRQSIPDYSSVMSLRCELSEDKLRGKTKKWVLHVGNCILVSVMRHLFIDIISADSQHNQYMFPKQFPDTVFVYGSKTLKVRENVVLARCFTFYHRTNVTKFNNFDLFLRLKTFLVIHIHSEGL